MTDSSAVVLHGSPRHRELVEAGWQVSEESFGAQFDAGPGVLEELDARAAALDPALRLRPLTADDVESVLALDAATAADYPGGPATAHPGLTLEQATPGPGRRGFGAFDGGSLVAMTWVDARPDSAYAEVHITVVAPAWRGRGVASALKATAVAELLRGGATRIRSGGSMRNTAILRANAALGFRIDERWLTLVPPLR